MNNAVSATLRLLVIVWLALGLSVPVSAWNVHNNAHSLAQVGLDDHHHHDHEGGISIHDHSDDDAPDGGHNHMPSILLGAVDLPNSVMVPQSPIFARPSFTIPRSDGIERHSSDGLRRPPRIG